ncbi:Serine/threonine protein kinase [Microbotryomycetes sp. JL201]|nr:Serine/threonine protein kinase [Microbotryomycetes sp. JL201]
MQSVQFDDEPACYTDESLSPSSSSQSSSSSYISLDAAVPVPQDTDYDDREPAQAPPRAPPAKRGPSADSCLPRPISPADTSFASAQAAMAAQNSSHSQNLIGHVIDNSSVGRASKLEFISILGLGAYGVVYLARDIAARPSAFPSSRAHPHLGNLPLYAVKCLNKVGLDSRQRSFQRREILLHGMASEHDNVVTLHNVIEEDTCIYVVLQFCDEGDLFGMITERQRYLGDDELIRNVFLQIVDAVEFCHQRNIYHRDLKPENVLCLDDGRRVVLADFGLATSERTSSDFGCGSTFYMSPECQGGLFQRLTTYSTPHNDIWSLGVILVNLTCGRNPWKQACPSDETFCAYLGNPDFLRSILPISEHTNRILKRIFALNPAMRISLKELRREVLSVKTFVMTEDELKHATRATKEAARAFGQTIPSEVEEDSLEESRPDEMILGTPVPSEDLPPATPVVRRACEDVNSNPATPTQPARRAAPITPPATPQPPNRPPLINQQPAKSGLKSSYSTDGTESDSSVDTLNSDEGLNSGVRRRRRQEIFSTPPQQPRSVFQNERHLAEESTLPPSPVTPTCHRRPRGTASRSSSPRDVARTHAGTCGSRRRKASVDSSSSSSGASASQPPTPTGLPPYGSAPPPLHYQLAHSVRIVDSNSPAVGHARQFAEEEAFAGKFAPAQSHSQVQTAYYPLLADWSDVADAQRSHYEVELPPPIFVPAAYDDSIYDLPAPPTTGYYRREPASNGQVANVTVREAAM